MRIVTGRVVGLAIQTALTLFLHASFGLAQCVEVQDSQLCRRLDGQAIVFEATVDAIEFKRLLMQDSNPRVMLPDSERVVHLRDVRTLRGDPQNVVIAPIFGDEDCLQRTRVRMDACFPPT